MHVTVEVVGDETHEVESSPDQTYGDLLGAVGVNHHEATVLVDGHPVPEDAPVDADSVQVLRLIKGG